MFTLLCKTRVFIFNVVLSNLRGVIASAVINSCKLTGTERAKLLNTNTGAWYHSCLTDLVLRMDLLKCVQSAIKPRKKKF